jgi:hypothetical protein
LAGFQAIPEGKASKTVKRAKPKAEKSGALQTLSVPLRFGTVTAYSEKDGVFVDYLGSAEGRPGYSAVNALGLSGAQLDYMIVSKATVILTFEPAEPARPVLFALTQPLPRDRDQTVLALRGEERVEISAGSARVVLDSDGTIEINGKQLTVSSEGELRLRGAINMN